jgi:hypothetical protein
VNRTLIAPTLAIITLIGATPAMADPAPDAHTTTVTAEDASPFNRDLALGVYASHWRGDYDSTGVGGRIRIEGLFGLDLGLDLYTEVLDVDLPAGSRTDVPLGFNLFVPFALSDVFRLRALGGLCAMFSFAEGDGIRGADADDVLFGYHIGGGVELGLGRQVSLFVDGIYQGYFGHERDTDAWSGNLKSELSRSDFVQVLAGLQVHL